MKIFWILSIISSFFISFGTPVTIKVDCDYKNNEFKAVGEIYICEVELTDYLSTQTSFNGIHVSGKSNSDVRGVKFENFEYETFPKSMEVTFDNLNAIYINDGLLKDIHETDLQPFPQLRYLDLFGNRLRIIEKDLFKHNPQLELIWLTNNLISSIHPDVFDHLTSLHHLYLMDNLCIKKSADGDRDGVKKIIDEVKAKCSNPNELIVVTTQRVRTVNGTDIEIQLKRTEDKLKEHEESLVELQTVNERLEAELDKKQDVISNCVEKNYEFETEKKTFKTFFIVTMMLCVLLAVIVAAMAVFIKRFRNQIYSSDRRFTMRGLIE